MADGSKVEAAARSGRGRWGARPFVSVRVFVLLLALAAGPASAVDEQPLAVTDVAPEASQLGLAAPSPDARMAGSPSPSPSPDARMAGSPSPSPDARTAGSPSLSPDARTAGSPSPSPDARTAGSPSPSPAALDWTARIDRLEARLARGAATRDEADALYEKILSELRSERSEVARALGTQAPDALERRAGLHELYEARVRLLGLVSPRLRSRLLGAGPMGRRELRTELADARLDVHFQTLAIPRGLHSIVESFFDDPLGFVGRFAELIFGLILFRLWRRWAARGLPEVREAVLAVRPRTELHLQLARLLWYVERFRSPLEWLALLYFVSEKIDPGDLKEVATLAGVILLWTLLTRLGLRVVDALAAGAEGSGEDRAAALRLRSLRLVGAWVLICGLGLDLISRYVGEAVIYTWALRVVILLSGPVVLLLVVWWRDEINRRVRRASGYSAVARRIRGLEKDRIGFPGTIAGAGYLIGASALRLAVRLASHFEGGRKMVATLLRREVEREAERAEESGEPIPKNLELALLTPDESVIAGPYDEALDRLRAHVATERGGTIAVLAERGGGIGTFLDLARGEIGDRMRIIDCPLGGFEKLQPVLAADFGLPEDADLEVELRTRVEAEGVRVIALHDLHRIVRPVMGGLVGLNRMARIVGSLGEDVLCIVTLTRDSWYYISRMLGDRAILHEVIQLPPWSEEQLEALVDARCRKAGIEPDYRRLSFPRQYDENERKSLEERNRFGYRRVLWELSDGNPEVAIRLFTDSLRLLPGDHVVVRLPQPASSSELATANLSTLLILKVLMETEFATLEDLQESIRERPEVLRSALSSCLQNEWVEQVYDHYQITWSAYRRVKGLLIRRGLLAR